MELFGRCVSVESGAQSGSDVVFIDEIGIIRGCSFRFIENVE
jgi:hypothetical protein